MNYSLLQLILLNVGHSSADELVKKDPYGLFLSLMSITVVVVVLAFIYLVFNALTKFLYRRLTQKTAKKANIQRAAEKISLPSGEVNAAIAMALYLYQKEQLSQEEASLTIKRITHRYSPWSSKIYSMRNSPR